ncbi:AMP-binding protein [Akkermansiaceae bacterium]|nr:AMP-binding protein [Akkermansiaceae bacterium]
MVTLDDLLLPDFWESAAPLVMDGNAALQIWAKSQPDLQGHLLFRSSGSAGVLKWIALSKSALWWSAERVVDYLKITSDDALVLALPVHHVGGFGLVTRAQVAHCCFLEYAESWSPVGFAEFCEQEEGTITSLVPTQISDLVREKITAPASLRAVVVGGGRLDDDLASAARALGWPLLASYGMTETASQIATQESGDEVDLPLIPGWEVRLDNGLLAVKGEGLLSGIVTASKGTFELYDPKSEGWFLTSDLAELHDGSLRILCRSDRRVKVLGELIDLDALEDFWTEKTGAPTALVALPDERRGQTLHLSFEGKADLIESLNTSLPGPERLASWESLAALPRNGLGKIDRSVVTRIHLD